MYAGWLEPMVLDKPTTVKGMKPSSQYGQTFIIYNDNNKNEYYLLETDSRMISMILHRQEVGLMITHVDYDPTRWKYNIVNTKLDKDNNLGEEYKLLENDHERCTLFRAGNPEILITSIPIFIRQMATTSSPTHPHPQQSSTMSTRLVRC